jgi:uncharacterized protein (TIGR03089 family)
MSGLGRLITAATTRDGPPWEPGVRNLSALAHRQVRRRGHQPFCTFYGDDRGERSELSYASFDNWASKTANLLVEEYGAGPGDVVASALDPSWIAVVAAFACWKVGATLWPVDVGSALAGHHGPGVTVAFVPERHAGTCGLESEQLIAVGDGFGGRLTRDVGAALGFGDEVGAFADDYDDPGVGLGVDALAVAGSRGARVRLGQRSLLAAADALGAWGLTERDRLLCGVGTAGVEGLVLAGLGAFTAGASLVLVHGQRPEGFWQRVGQERVTLAALAEADRERLPAGDAAGFRGFLAAGRPGITRHGPQPVFRGLGVIEAACAATLGPAALDVATARWVDVHPLAYAGCPTAHADVAALGADGRPGDHGAPGELAVRGPVVASGHWAPNELDAGELDRAIYAGGWLRTGRRGVVEVGPDGREHVFVELDAQRPGQSEGTPSGPGP